MHQIHIENLDSMQIDFKPLCANEVQTWLMVDEMHSFLPSKRKLRGGCHWVRWILTDVLFDMKRVPILPSM